MTTVRLSGQIRGAVAQSLHAGFNTREQLLMEAARKRVDWTQLAVDVRRVFLSKEDMTEDLLSRIPHHWTLRVSTISITEVNGEKVPPTFRNVELLSPVPHPPQSNPSYGARVSDDSLQGFADAMRELNEQLCIVADERHKSLRALDNIFDKCTTLKQALELWPGLMDMLPKWVVDRHNEAPAKRTAPTALEIGEVALDTLNAAAVKNKLASVNVA